MSAWLAGGFLGGMVVGKGWLRVGRGGWLRVGV
jgi:hypothetical protein